MAFDVEGARKAGYSEAEIAEFLGTQSNFDVKGAQKAGYSAQEIIKHLLSQQPAPAPTPAQVPTTQPTVADVPQDFADPESALMAQDAMLPTSEGQKTAISEAAPDWVNLPEAQSFDWTSLKTALGTIAAGPEEIAQIIKANYPGVKVSQDEKGNYLLTSGIDNQVYAIKPGFRVSDIPRALATAASFVPAGRAPSLLGQALKSGATQAGIEATQAATGGEFNPAEVAIQTAAAPVLPLAGRAFRGAQAAFTKPAQEAVSAAEAGLGDIAQTAKQATGVLSGAATERLAAQAAPEQAVVEAAQRLGIVDNLQPDHISSNGAFVEFSQALKSIPGSEARQAELRGLEEVTKRAVGVIDELGGTTDLSSLNASVRSRMMRDIEVLGNKADEAFTTLGEVIPQKTIAAPTNTLQFLQQQIDNLGGIDNLSPMEREIFDKLSKRVPTYALLNAVRQDVGAVTRGKGPFKDSNTGLAKKLYTALSEDQRAVARQFGKESDFEAANQLVRVRKGIEDDATALFGKNLDNSMLNQADRSVKELSKGDADKLAKFISAVPKDMRQNVVASSLASAFGKSARGGNFNFTTYTTWYEGVLKNKEAYNTLLGNLPPEARSILSDLYTVSRGISRATSQRIQTGRINIIKDELKGVDTLISSIFGAFAPVAGASRSGIAAGAMTALSKVASKDHLKLADGVISSPEFMRLVAGADKPEQAPMLIRALAVSDAFKRFGKEILGATDRYTLERFITNGMQTSAAMDRTEY